MKKMTIGKSILHQTAVIEILRVTLKIKRTLDTSQSESSCSSDDMSHESDMDDV